LVFIPVVLIIRKKRQQLANDVEGNRIRTADRLAKKFLSEAKKNLGQKELFYESLHKSLHNYLKAKLHIETSEFSKEKIDQLLTEKQVENNAIKEFISLLESCELARFTPSNNVTMQQDYDKAARVINLIDKQIS
ncbi:MAG: protein BatD, partial [Flavobacteriaceae bacterium]|nr:protein BatD [Flavobacteriaceae bacterium]